MTAKEYLSRAYRLDQRVNSKLEQVEVLRALAQKVTTSYESEPVSRSRCVTSLEDTITRMIEAEADLNQTVDALVDLKMEMAKYIDQVENYDDQLVLEKRYLCFKTWEQIADDMNFSRRWVQIVHARALNAMDSILRERGEILQKSAQ